MMSVRDNLRIGFNGGPKEEARTLERVLTDFPRLVRLLDRIGGTLSGGEQQLLSLARCLCGDPHLMLLDEPTEGIQPSIIEEIAETLRTLNKKRRLTLIVVEQNFEFLKSLSTTMLRMHKGRIVDDVGDGLTAGVIDALDEPDGLRRLRLASSH